MAISAAEQTDMSGQPQRDRLRALPARYYVDEQVLAQEKERLFFRTWQYVCHVSALAKPGAYVTAEILGQKVFVVRTRSDEIKAFYNVCPHRGHQLLEGAGSKQAIVCPYHHWNFTLDGDLRRHRTASTSEAPELSEICLSPVRVDRMLDFIFVNLDPDALSIADFWPGAEEHIRTTCPDIESYTISTSATVIHSTDVAANWKIQVDNFLECQHCRHGHKSFSDMLDIPNQFHTLHENYAYNFIPSSGKADNLAYPLDPAHDVMDLHFWYLFPNLGFGQFAGPGNFSLSQWLPAGPDRATRISVSLEAAEPTDPGMADRRERRAAWARDVLQPEDIAFMESVHQGMYQRCFTQGWYIVDWENQELSESMVRHFHDHYLEHMGET